MKKFSLRSLLCIPVGFSLVCIAASIVADAVAETFGAVTAVIVAVIRFVG